MAKQSSHLPRRKRVPAASSPLSLFVIPGLPEIRKGQNLATAVAVAARRAKITLEDGDILVFAQKIVSKAEGRTVRLSTVRVSPRGGNWRRNFSSDARLVEVILRESRRVVRSDRVLIVETHHGFVCANAGVDHSNVRGGDFRNVAAEES